MGSGLIWAGLGKGISDAGSAVGSAMMADLREQRLLERQAALEELRETNRVAREERQAQQRMQQAEQATTMADEMGRQRTEADISAGASRAAGNAAQMPGASPAASEAEIRELIKANPQAREQYAKAGLISEPMTRNQERLQRAEDEYSAAAKSGAHSTVLESFDKKRARVLEEIRIENAEKKEDRRYELDVAREDRRERESAAREVYMGRMAGAAETRANRPAGGSASDPNKPATTADMQRQINAAKDDIALELGVPKNDVNTAIASLKRRAERGDQRAKAQLDSISPYLNELQDANERMRQFKRADEPKSDASVKPKSDNGNVKSEPGKLPQPKSQQEFSSIPRGTRYMAPDGTIRIKS